MSTGSPHAGIADTLLAADSTAQYLIHRMVSIDERYAVLAPRQGNAFLMRLGRKYGPRVVVDALRRLREEADSTGQESSTRPRDVLAMTETMCRLVAHEGELRG